MLFCRVRLNGKKPKDKAYPKEVKTLGDAIRKRRLDLGLRQKDVAKIIGCDEASILNWEKGHTSPSSNIVSDIRRFFGPHAKRPKTEGFGAKGVRSLFVISGSNGVEIAGGKLDFSWVEPPPRPF